MLGTLLKWYGGIDGAKPKEGHSHASSKHLSQLYEGDRGLHDLHLNDAELRLWLPVPVKHAINECLAEMNVNAAKYIREYFVVYLYGAHELLRMKADNTGLYFAEEPKPVIEKPNQANEISQPAEISENVINFSSNDAVESIPGLGKNIVPIKIFINAKIKADLEALAVMAKFPSGSFVRELLVSHFLGHTVWAERNPAWTAAQQKEADDWVEGKIKFPFSYGFLEDW
jgi:hypothetical protein